ncbi:DNRLRE domain-containing protein [Streptomyces sp. NPDC059477]|uniref:DNRLRE domain-containing protein n=1 Tax=Streptomyces sp. NPDC059477 TaxID=3346847 RepID=UPI0036970189
MERRRFGLPAAGRGRAGLAAVVAAALGFGLLAVPLLDGGDAPGAGGSGGSDGSTGSSRTEQAAGPLDEDAAQTRAVSTGERVEVTALRDETSTTYARPDGSFELVTYAAPVRAKVDGAWRPIDTRLARTGEGWAAEAVVDPVVFSAGGDGSGAGPQGAARVEPAVFTAGEGGRTLRIADETAEYTELATLTSDGHEVTLSWPGPLPAPVISGSSALYRGVLDGVDLMLTAQESGFSQVLIVHSAADAANPALTSLSYGLSSPDLTFHLDPVTKVVTGRDRDGEEIAVSPTPYMWDSAGEYAVTEGPDPEPTAEPAEPTPSYSQEPDAPIGEETLAPDAGSDSAAPTEEPVPAPPATEETEPPAEETDPPGGETPVATGEPDPPAGDADPAAHRGDPAPGADAVPRTPYRNGTDGTGPSGDALRTALDDSEVFALPGLAGPDPGTHMAVVEAGLTEPGTTATGLSIVPDAQLLADPGTVYPVFIDPTIYGKTKHWTTAYKKYPSSSFYDGTNYNTGTTEARVGFESTTWGLSRSFFTLGWSTSIKGAQVSSASIELRETYSWSCSAREMQVWLTGGISSKTTWNNQPDWKSEIGTKSFAHGYNSSCPDAYVTYDAKSVAQDAADGGWSSLTIGLRATTEDSAYGWKKFRAESDSAPKLRLVYNRKPKTPTAVTMSPGNACDKTSPYLHIGKRNVILSAASSDPDDTSLQQDLKYLDFELWHTGATTKILNRNVVVTSTGKASVEIGKEFFTDGWTYSWRVRAIDQSGAASAYAPTASPGVCRFVFDSSKPNEPIVTSTAFPAADDDGTIWSAVKFGTPGVFTLAPDDDTDVTRFEWSFNTTSYSSGKNVTAGSSTTVSLSPPMAGPNVLYTRAVDSAGNPSLGAKYLFYVTPRDKADEPGDLTGDGTPDVLGISAAGNLWMYPSTTTGDLHVSLSAAHDDGIGLLTDPDRDGTDHLPGYWMGPDGEPALIAHGGDALGADGIGDVFARMPDGELYIYPGDGYGSVDISRRMSVRLPAGSPDPATLDQIVVGDYDLDGRTDLFATAAGGALWAFDGYTGATFLHVTKISATAWLERDLVSVGDHDDDGAPDLLWRSEASSRLLLRYGVGDSAGGSTIASLSTAAASRTGADTVYAEGWDTTTVPVTHLRGTPDVNGDGIPDLWAVAGDNAVHFYQGGASVLGSHVAVISPDSDWRTGQLTLG